MVGETWNSESACDVTPDLDFDLIESVYPLRSSSAFRGDR